MARVRKLLLYWFGEGKIELTMHGGARQLIETWIETSRCAPKMLANFRQLLSDETCVNWLRAELLRLTLAQLDIREDAGKMPAATTPPRPVIPAGWVWQPPDPSWPARREGEWAHNPDGVFHAEAIRGQERFLRASVRGRGHKQDGSFCDDSGKFFHLGGWRVIVVSDGAGSARFSRVGSQLACDTVAREFERSLAECDLTTAQFSKVDLEQIQRAPSEHPRFVGILAAFQQAFESAQAQISDWVARKNDDRAGVSDERAFIDRKERGNKSEGRRRKEGGDASAPLDILDTDLNCTLLVCACTTVKYLDAAGKTQDNLIAVSCAIGDGMIAAFRKGDSKSLPAIMLMAPDAGEFAGETQFLSQSNVKPESIAARFSVRSLGDPSSVVAVAAMSDGVADDYFGETGMERVYCDLILNHLLPCHAAEDEIAREAQAADLALKARSAEAVKALLGLAQQATGSLSPAEMIRLKQETERLQNCARQDSLAALVALEPIFGPPIPGVGTDKHALKYGDRYLEALGLGAAELLKRPGLLRAIARSDSASLASSTSDTFSNSDPIRQAERLMRWIDCYIVKGSFDDRTVVMFATGEGA